jgi:glycogen debranching enzyme
LTRQEGGKMSDEEQSTHLGKHRQPIPLEERERRKQHVLTHGQSSMTRGIAGAVVVKREDVFFLTEPDGRVPLDDGHGFGLYYHDCRFLNGYELSIAGTRPDALISTATHGFMAVIELTNPDLEISEGRLIKKETIGIQWTRVIDSATPVLADSLIFQDFGLESIELPMALTFRAEFEDIFAVRGTLPPEKGKLHPPHWKDGILCFIYHGADGMYRSLSIHFTPTPSYTEGTTAQFLLRLKSEERVQLSIWLTLAESQELSNVRPEAHEHRDARSLSRNLRDTSDSWLANHTEVRSDNLFLHRILDRSLHDLHMLKSRLKGYEYFAAGVPWFVTLFGRDSLIAALEALAYAPDMAEHTLRLLAGYQGRTVDPERDEEPGKILHELRIGEMARLHEIPQTPYYGTIDATLLFLIVLGRHAAWTGNLNLFHDLRAPIEKALAWMVAYGDRNGDGYLEYQSASHQGLANQGWKDSGDAIVNDDGSLATPPIALVEVQGYAYLAKTTLADLYQRAGESQRAEQLRREAEELRARFNQDFWLAERGIYALALQAEGRPASVVSPNPGHALWSGIADPDKARQTVERLMAEDMFSGWGIRTLSAKERRYSPIAYHLGTVWPHDNALIAAGCRRYGCDDAAMRLFAGHANVSVRSAQVC